MAIFDTLDRRKLAVTTGGTEPNYTVTVSPAPTAYVTGQIFAIRIHTTLLTTGGATLNVNGLGAKPMKIGAAGNATRITNPYELSQRQVYYVAYDGTDDLFRILNPTPASYVLFVPSISASAGTITVNSSNCMYRIHGDMVFLNYEFNFGLSGSTATIISATIPFLRYNIYRYQPITCYMSGVAGASSYSAISSTNAANKIDFYRSDSFSNFPIDSAMIIRATGFYQASVL
jgi:hypothetical protein